MKIIHIDSDIEEEIQGPKTDIEDKVKMILKLIKDGDLVMDGTPEEILKREPLAELVKDIGNITNEVNVLQQEVESLYLETIGENLKLIIQIESMKEEVDRKIMEQERLNMEEREHLTMEIGKLELEISILKSKTSEDKEQEISCLTQQKLELEERLAERESELSVLQDKNMDLQRTLEDKKDAYQKLNEEYIQIDSDFNECKVNLEDAKRNMQQMTEEHAQTLTIVEQAQEREEDLSATMKKLKDNENESSSKISYLTSQINNLQADISSLHAKKNELEKQMIFKSNEAREMGEHNLELRNQISELEMKSKEREEELSAIMKKLEDNENESSSKISDLTSQINNLQADISSLVAKKNELEEQIVFKSNEASTRVENITNELNVLQQEVESLQQQKSDLEVQLVDKSRENSECLIQIRSLNDEVGRKTQEQDGLIEDNENLTRHLRDLELEMSTLKSKNSKDEEQIRANIQEISHLQDKIYKAEEEASGKIIAFTAEVDNLQKDLLSLQKTKEGLEHCCEKLREEHAQTLTIVDNEKNEVKQLLSEKEEELQQVQRVFNEHIGSKDRMVAVLEHQLEDLRKLMKANDECARQKPMEAIRQLTLEVRGLKKTNADLRDIISSSSSCCGLC